jgi:hypothetical protein
LRFHRPSFVTHTHTHTHQCRTGGLSFAYIFYISANLSLPPLNPVTPLNPSQTICGAASLRHVAAGHRFFFIIILGAPSKSASSFCIPRMSACTFSFNAATLFMRDHQRVVLKRGNQKCFFFHLRKQAGAVVVRDSATHMRLIQSTRAASQQPHEPQQQPQQQPHEPQQPHEQPHSSLTRPACLTRRPPA